MAPAKAKRDVSYKDAMEELEDIVAKVDDRNVDIDDLAKNVKELTNSSRYVKLV